MAWSTNNSGNFISIPNSTVTTCVSCLYDFTPGYAAVLSFNCLVSLPLEAWVLWLYASSPITEKTDLLSYNFCIYNFLIALANLLTMPGILFFSQSHHFMLSLLISLTALGHPLFQCLISVERYLAVEHPTVFIRYRPVRYRAAILVPGWMSALVICCVGVSVCATQDNFTIFLIFQFTLFLLILGISSFCYVTILRVLIRPPPGDGRKGSKEGRPKSKEHLNHQIKKKAFIMVSLIQLYVMSCYLPPLALVFSNPLEERHFCGIFKYNLGHVLFSSDSFCLYYLHKVGKLKWLNCARKR